jgi:SAM-dependent methyltransferase
MTTAYSPTKDEVIAFYNGAIPLINRLAGQNVHYGYWPTPEDNSTLHQAMDNLTEVMIERIRVTAGQRVLDVGCGLGGPAIRLARTTGAEVVGIGTSPIMIEEANARVRAEGLSEQVRFEVADAMDELPFPARSFDAAWAIESFVHMSNRGAALRQIGRALRPGGWLALTDFYERIPFTGDRLAKIEEYRRTSLNTPFLRLEDYPPMMRWAGLDLIEYLDISEEVSRHYPGLLERLNQFRSELEDEYGSEAVAALESTFKNCAESGEPNYMLMTARRS